MHSFAVIIFLVSAVISTATVVQSKTISIGVPIQLHHLDPFDLRFLEEWEVFGGVHDTLLEFQILSGYKGKIAERWSFDKKKKVLTFNLRKELKFSDGSELTASDVAFSLRRLIYLDHDNSLSITRCLGHIAGKTPSHEHPKIKVVDNLTVALGPTTCGEVLLKELAEANHGIISPKSVDSNYRFEQSKPVSGPFTYSSKTDLFILTPNYFNWQWRPKLKESKLVTTVNIVSSQRFANSGPDSLPKVDVFRTANPEVLDAAKKQGYQAATSLPSMVSAPSRLFEV